MSTTKQYIQEAAEIQNQEGSTSQNALKMYMKAISAYKHGDSDDEYDLLFAHYQIMWIYASSYEIDKALPYAEKCMELMDKTIRSGAIFHFTEMGKFHEEVIRFATNTIAWDVYERSDDTKKLEEALETVSLGCNYADDPSYFFIFDTKVRILLKLGHKEEAFRIVYDCLRKDPHFSDFSDIKVDKEYREWKERFESDTVTDYSDTEKELLEKAARITSGLKEKLVEKEQYSNQFKEIMPEKELVAVKEIKKKYDIPQNYYEDTDYLLLYKGDVHIKGDLDAGWYKKQLKGMTWENYLYGIVIDGNLVVDGDITIDEPVLYILRDITCDYLFSGDGHTQIDGNAHIRYGIYGQYNDGSLDISGTLVTPYIIADDHSMPRRSEGEFIYIEGGDGSDMEDVSVGESYGSGIGWGWHYFDDSLKLFSKSMRDEDYKFSVKRFFDIVKRGENPFKVL